LPGCACCLGGPFFAMPGTVPDSTTSRNAVFEPLGSLRAVSHRSP
jgi:hypothetical protein